MLTFFKKFKGFKKINFGQIGKRQFVLAGLILMIAVAGYINVNYDTDKTVPASVTVDDQTITPSPKKTDYFSTTRMDKEKSRSAAMDIYRELIQNNSSSPEVKAKAQNDLSNCAKAIELEPVIEGLIKAKGFEDTSVYISEASVNVVVKTTGLVPAQVAQIKDLVIDKTKISSDKIKIVEIK